MRILSILVVALLLAGCEEPPDRNEVNWATPIGEGTLLTLDPTERIEFARWWTNGQELLRLDQDHRFALYEDQNRYHLPIVRGRWDQQSYAVLRLEPYSLLGREPVRVSLTRLGGELEIRIPKLDPFQALQQAPKTNEDSLFGAWGSSLGTLQLESTMRYTFKPKKNAAGSLAKAGHKGRWNLRGKVITLIPDAIGLGPYQLSLMAEQTPVLLTTVDGEFEQISESDPAF